MVAILKGGGGGGECPSPPPPKKPLPGGLLQQLTSNPCEHVNKVLLHTHIYTYIHQYSGNFLICMIYVGLASACPNNKQ